MWCRYLAKSFLVLELTEIGEDGEKLMSICLQVRSLLLVQRPLSRQQSPVNKFDIMLLWRVALLPELVLLALHGAIY